MLMTEGQMRSERPRVRSRYVLLCWLIVLNAALVFAAVPPIMKSAAAADDIGPNGGNATESKDPAIGKVTPLHKAVKSGRERAMSGYLAA